MSDKDMPSRMALDLAVKPAGFQSWDEFCTIYHRTGGVNAMALAYAADLDKADKLARMVLEATPEKLPAGPARDCRELARELILPDAIDPDLLEAEMMLEVMGLEHCGQRMSAKEILSAGIKRGRELAKEQDRG